MALVFLRPPDEFTASKLTDSATAVVFCQHVLVLLED
jgi:hypothetical protein